METITADTQFASPADVVMQQMGTILHNVKDLVTTFKELREMLHVNGIK